MWIILVILNMVLVQVLVSMESFEHNEHVIVHTISFPANLKFLTDFFYMLHNGNTMVTQCYTMVHVTQWYMLHNGICYTMVHVTQWYMLLSHFALYNLMTSFKTIEKTTQVTKK